MRRGFTLIELLVVILILLMITAVTLPAIRSALEGRKVREAARMVEVFISGARSRAIRSGHSIGIVIQPDEQNPAQCVKLSYAEQPDPYTGDFAKSRIAILGNGGFGVWATVPQLTLAGPMPGSSSPNPVFPQGDIGWLENVAPGDLFYLAQVDGVLFRLWLGEPYIDLNGNGQFDAGEPFNDIDGSGLATNGEPPGSGYTPPNPSYIDPITGFINKPIPPISWGSQSAVLTYTYADPTVAVNYMCATGLAFDNKFSNTACLPIYLDAKFASSVQPIATPAILALNGGKPMSLAMPFAAFGLPSLISYYQNGVPGGALAFRIYRRPVVTSSTSVPLPGGACIDLGCNYIDPATKNIVGVPGSGLETLIPFSSGNSTLGFYASFRPNPLLDPMVEPNSPTDLISRPIMITFDASGVVDWVYSFDERHFIGNNSQAGNPINFTDFQARKPASPIYLLIGQTALVGGNPETLPALAGGTPPKEPIFNMQDPTSLWVAINPRTGLVSTTENVPPDLTQAPPTTQTAAAPEIQLYLNAQTYKARSLAREALDMGGM